MNISVARSGVTFPHHLAIPPSREAAADWPRVKITTVPEIISYRAAAVTRVVGAAAISPSRKRQHGVYECLRAFMNMECTSTWGKTDGSASAPPEKMASSSFVTMMLKTPHELSATEGHPPDTHMHRFYRICILWHARSSATRNMSSSRTFRTRMPRHRRPRSEESAAGTIYYVHSRNVRLAEKAAVERNDSHCRSADGIGLNETTDRRALPRVLDRRVTYASPASRSRATAAVNDDEDQMPTNSTRSKAISSALKNTSRRAGMSADDAVARLCRRGQDRVFE